jgi:hypothetical protein
MLRVLPANLAKRMSHRHEALLMQALSAAETKACAGDVSARDALAAAASELQVHEGTLAMLWLEKLVQCHRAREALAASAAPRGTGRIVTLAEAAADLGRSVYTLQRWVDKGMPLAQRGERGAGKTTLVHLDVARAYAEGDLVVSDHQEERA